MDIHIKNGVFCSSNEIEFPFLQFWFLFLSKVLDSFLSAIVVGLCDVKHPTEELHRDTLRLLRSCWNSLVQWILHGFFLLSVHCMTSACFSFLLFFQVDTEFCPSASQLEYQLLSLSCVTAAHSNSWCVWEKIHCSFWTAQTSNSASDTYLSASCKKKENDFNELLLPCKLILQNIHVLGFGCEILMPY